MNTEDEMAQRVNNYKKTASLYDKIIYAVITVIFTFCVSSIEFSDELIIDESLYSTIGLKETAKKAYTEKTQRAKDNYKEIITKSNILNITLFFLCVSAMYFYVLAAGQRNKIIPSWGELPDKYESFNFIDRALPGLMLSIIIPLFYFVTMHYSGMATLDGFNFFYDSADLIRLELLRAERNFFFLLHFVAILPLLCTFFYTIIKRGNFVIQLIATLVSGAFIASIYNIIFNAATITI